VIAHRHAIGACFDKLLGNVGGDAETVRGVIDIDNPYIDLMFFFNCA
jgi:hypothetical protein